MDAHSLQPLTHGNVLIVGAKQSNFDQELIDHPRVILWDSQNLKWMGKDIPQNVRAIFMTRWIGHTSFATILKEARKKHITVFNVDGTGSIARQVRELLDLHRLTETKVNEVNQTMTETTTDARTSIEHARQSITGFRKLHALIPFIDQSKNNVQNARLLLVKAQELGITTTVGSLSVFVGRHRDKPSPRSANTHPVRKIPVRRTQTGSPNNAVSVDILDHLIKELQDLRGYYIAIERENHSLKAKLDKFRKMIAE